MDKILTVLTPTFNRADTLAECWRSLAAQTSRSFQWLIIDDGSTDDTEAAVRGFMDAEPQMDIEYHKKANGGKHTALNASHPFIRGDYVMVLDSDDRLIPTAVADVLSAWERFAADPRVGRVIFLKGYSEEQPICRVQNAGIPVDTLKEARIGETGRDCCDTFRSELFRKYAFPEFEGERFIGEGSAFFPMELESLGVYYNNVIYLCDYREDGLTRAGRKMRLLNPRGGMYNSRVYMHKRLPLKTRIKKGILYACYSRYAGVKFADALRQNEYKALTLFTFLPGLCLAFYWKRKFFR